MILMLRRFRFWPDMCIAITGGLLLGFVIYGAADTYFAAVPKPVAAEILLYEVSPAVLTPGGEVVIRVVSRRYIDGCKVSGYRQIEASDRVLVSFAAVDVIASEQEERGVFESRATLRVPDDLAPGPARMHSVAFYDCGAKGTHTVLSPWVDLFIRAPAVPAPPPGR